MVATELLIAIISAKWRSDEEGGATSFFFYVIIISLVIN